MNFRSANIAGITAAVIHRWGINGASVQRVDFFFEAKTLANIAVHTYVTTSEVERNDRVDSCGLPQNWELTNLDEPADTPGCTIPVTGKRLCIHV